AKGAPGCSPRTFTRRCGRAEAAHAWFVPPGAIGAALYVALRAPPARRRGLWRRWWSPCDRAVDKNYFYHGGRQGAAERRTLRAKRQYAIYNLRSLRKQRRELSVPTGCLGGRRRCARLAPHDHAN